MSIYHSLILSRPLIFLRQVCEFIIRVYDYLPILWNDRDWDYAFIYKLLEFKLKRVEKDLTAGIVDCTKTQLHSVRLSIKLLNRLHSHEYGARSGKLFDAKWGELLFIETPVEGKPYVRVSFHREKATTPELAAQQRVEALACYKLEEELQSRDRRNVFAIISKYCEGWWT